MLALGNLPGRQVITMDAERLHLRIFYQIRDTAILILFKTPIDDFAKLRA